MRFSYHVTAHYASAGLRVLYDGGNTTDAMAAWSNAVSEGVEYVFLEALREEPVK